MDYGITTRLTCPVCRRSVETRLATRKEGGITERVVVYRTHHSQTGETLPRRIDLACINSNVPVR